MPGLAGALHAYTADLGDARPDILSLNPNPMTFRGSGSSPSSVLVTSFDDTLRTAFTMREKGVKPQVFIYHPGGLDLLGELIARDAIAKPYFVQLVFGQQGGIGASLDSFLYITRNLPSETIYQACALGSAAIRMNLLSLLHGGHVRTGMEDALDYLPGEQATGNAQLVERIVRFARDLGRLVASPAETRRLLGLAPLSRKENGQS
jgi:3-keto-5-aminohexanoate cleavage enzyme